MELSGYQHKITTVFRCQITVPSLTTAPLGMMTTPSRT
jgi:hypothetical protein